MRILAIDLGTRRVGVAIGDSESKLAAPLEVLEVRSPEEAMGRVLTAIGREQPAGVLVGVPINMDDTLGRPARDAIAWGRELARRAKLPVIFVDERLSSFVAEGQLAARRRAGESLTRGKKKQRRDALAAAAFLQDYLDGRAAALDLAD